MQKKAAVEKIKVPRGILGALSGDEDDFRFIQRYGRTYVYLKKNKKK